MTTAPAAAPVSRYERIKHVAREQFAQRGFEAASMRDIAADAGITISTLYFHCTTKELLLFDVLKDSWSGLLDGLRDAIAAAGPSETARLGAAITFHVQTNAERTFDTGSHTFLRHLSAEHRANYASMRDAYDHTFRQLIRDGITTGEFRAVDPKLTAFAMLSIGQGVGRWFRADGPLSSQEVAEHAVELVLYGLTPG